MARDTDRKKISEAARVSERWTLRTSGESWAQFVKLAPNFDGFVAWVNVDYGKKDQVQAAHHRVDGEPVEFITARRRERILEIFKS